MLFCFESKFLMDSRKILLIILLQISNFIVQIFPAFDLKAKLFYRRYTQKPDSTPENTTRYYFYCIIIAELAHKKYEHVSYIHYTYRILHGKLLIKKSIYYITCLICRKLWQLFFAFVIIKLWIQATEKLKILRQKM